MIIVSDTVVDLQETLLDESQSLFQRPLKKIKFGKDVVTETECSLCFKNISTNMIEEHYEQNHPDRIMYGKLLYNYLLLSKGGGEGK